VAEDVGAAQDAGSAADARLEALTGPVERALEDLGIEWKNVMAFGVHGDRVVIVQGPVGYKRAWWFPASGAKAGADVSGGTT